MYNRKKIETASFRRKKSYNHEEREKGGAGSERE